MQLRVHIDEGKGAHVAQRRALAVAAVPHNRRLHRDRRVPGKGDAADVVQLVAHAHRLVEVDAVHAHQQRAMAGHHLRADMRHHVRAMRHVSTEDLVRHILVLHVRPLPALRLSARTPAEYPRPALPAPRAAAAAAHTPPPTEERLPRSDIRDNSPAAAAPVRLGPSIHLAAILQARQRNAALRPILLAQPRHHGEVARRHMQHRPDSPGCSIRMPTSSDVLPTRFTRARSTMSRVSSGTPRTRMESIAAVTTRAAG